ncbi:MAG: nickel pincer cofactor biosynthesis protein LarC [Candidatus Margulisbacteria bacterium]|nr:nickel pincer cofactor biosynthesis protein LarC [Candidatus Margulisiibacteriota bacterium]
MKTAYFDCSSGIAGDMVLGALVDAGLDQTFLNKELKKLEIRDWKLDIKKIKRSQLRGTHLEVKTKPEHHHRHLKDILKIIRKSKLSKDVKQLSSRIFKKLAQAEAKVHGTSIDKVHFHEVGAVDAIIDIVGSCIGLEKLGIQQVFCSPLPTGKGKIKCAHGTLPIPTPATIELLKGVPIYSGGVNGELVTPTGAAIITSIASSFGDIPRLRLEAEGRGAGTRLYPQIPNFLRVYLGQSLVPSEKDAIVQIEANIDDMDPKSYDKVIASLMKAGALDAYTIPVLMKKHRQGVQLVVLCTPDNRHPIVTRVFELTTTFGVRVYLVPREKLARKFKTVKTKYGKAKVKVGQLGQKTVTIAPEYEDYKRLARKHRIPIQKAYKETLRSL